MSEVNGIVKDKMKRHGIVPLEHTEAHLQDEIDSSRCYCCHKPVTDEMVLLRTNEKKLNTVCLDHPGIVQEFLRQFKKAPLGWKQYLLGASHGDRPGSTRDNNR